MKYEGLYDVQQKIENNESVLFLFSRLNDKTKRIEKITNFKPYFFVPIDTDVPPDFRIVSVESEERKTLDNISVKKIVCRNAQDIYKVRSLFPVTYEADCLFYLRYYLDNVDEIENKILNKSIIDIETTMASGFPDPMTAEEQITSICVYNTFLNVYNVFVWHASFTKSEKEKMIINERNINIHKCLNEKEVLEKFLTFETTIRSDVWIAWNIPFDFPYIINRMKKNNLNYLSLSPISIVNVNERDKMAQIGGIITFDLMYWLKRVRLNEFSSYSLANVAEVELGEKKGDVRDPYKLWLADWKSAVEYNIQDVYLVKKIDEKRRIFDWVNEIRILAKCNFSDIVYFSRIIDIFIHRKFKNEFIFPTKPPFKLADEKLEGGRVKDPIIGMYKNVAILDINALYPNLIKTFNLSYDTLCSNGDIKIDNGYSFTSEKVGLLPQILDDLFTLRKKWKDEMKKCTPGTEEYNSAFDRQFAAKFLVNTLYGANALPSFRFFKPEVASTITYLGRKLNLWCEERIEKDLNYKVIQSDTDSVFVVLPENIIDKNELHQKAEEIAKYLNEHFIDFCKPYNVHFHTLNIEAQHIYSPFLSCAKKRYAGLNIDLNKIEVVGLQIRRSDYSKMSKTLQMKALDMLMKDNCSKEEIAKIVKEEIAKIKNKVYTYEEIAIPTKIDKKISDYTGNIPKKRACLWSAKYLNLHYDIGSKPLFLWIRTLDNETDSLLFENNKELIGKEHLFYLDIPKMVERNILMVLDSILTPLKWDVYVRNASIGQNSLLSFVRGNKYD